MRRNRAGYISLIVILLVMLFFSGQLFLLYMAVMLILLAAIMALLLLRDAVSIHAGLFVNPAGQYGKELPYTLSIGSKWGLFITRSVLVELEIYNKMFDSVTYRTIHFELKDGKNDCVVQLMAEQCGQLSFRCRSIYIADMLNLFRFKTKPFKSVDTIVYPKHIDVNVQLSDMIRGENISEGNMLNKKGNDRSEVYDIRAYKAGDDIRTIHWKLSEKTDQLIVRESSEPSHYDVVIIPDFGHSSGIRKATLDELNTAVSLTVEIAGRFMAMGVHFCVMIPTKDGLNEIEVADAEAYERMLEQAMSFRILEKAGTGLEYFLMEHREYSYTRMVIISAGRYEQNLSELEGRMGVSIINAVDDREQMSTESIRGFELIEIPAADTEGQTYNIVC